jgi:hypothetical protein
LEQAAQEATKGRETGNDIVISSKYDLFLEDTNWQLLKEPLKVFCGICSDMGSQTIAPSGRQIVYKGDIAKMVSAVPIHPMGFERVTAIGDKKQDNPTRLKDTDHFLNRVLVVPDVFKYFMTENSIECQL